MKRINKLFLLMLLFAPALFSCERDLESEGISRVTNFPTFTMEGDQYASVVMGGTFTDPGVSATEGGQTIPVTVSGSVNTSTPGIYTLTYSAINSDGFPGRVTRTVAVIPEAEEPGVDLSGKYSNVDGNANTAGLVNTVTKLAPGFYLASNIWGGTSAAVIPAYFFSTDGENITLPLSALSGYGRARGTGTISASGLITWVITLEDQGPATATKKWQRQ